MLRGLMVTLWLFVTTAAIADPNKDCDEGGGDVAIAGCTELIQRDPHGAAAYYKSGNAYTDERDYDRSVAGYSKVIELNPKHAATYSNRGNAYNKKGDSGRPTADHNKAI
jgi:tetratricopeptide (TPR) repeat protein